MDRRGNGWRSISGMAGAPAEPPSDLAHEGAIYDECTSRLTEWERHEGTDLFIRDDLDALTARDSLHGKRSSAGGFQLVKKPCLELVASQEDFTSEASVQKPRSVSRSSCVTTERPGWRFWPCNL